MADLKADDRLVRIPAGPALLGPSVESPRPRICACEG